MPARAKYRLLPHTSDVLYEAYGKTFEEGLENAALAMFETIADVKKLKRTKSFKLETHADSLENLVSYSLGDLLAASDGEDVFFSRLNVQAFRKTSEGYLVRGTARGEPRMRAKGRMDVKAVTLHQTQAEQLKDKSWRLRVLLDI